MTDDPTTVRREAADLADQINAHRLALAEDGFPTARMDDASARVRAVIEQAQRLEALTAGGERLDPDEFTRRVRARRRMTALRAKPKPEAPPKRTPAVTAGPSSVVPIRVVRR